MNNPYSSLPNYNFWYKSVSIPPSGSVDPVVKSFKISIDDKVATMGSCFAQHLSKNIRKHGFNYFITESCPNNLTSIEGLKFNYGIFSARYGNVYTVKQALQLFDRAFNLVDFNENIWERDGSFVDAFRPLIEPNGFASKDDLLNDRVVHLKNVRKIFEESNWLIFTLGLTEAWQSKVDNAIFPVAPGVNSGSFDVTLHEFVNFSVYDVIDQLNMFIEKCKSVNPKLKIILTVSPVPLVATYENRHVLTSTVASKSILRAASDFIERKFSDVVYFPSYEIITSPSSDGKYFEDDFRGVKEIGVNHVMRVFSKHFFTNDNVKLTNEDLIYHDFDIVCDEEVIANALNIAGY